MARVAVVGSGATGLTAAVTLAGKGHAVSLFERGPALSTHVLDSPFSESLRRWLIDAHRPPPGDVVSLDAGSSATHSDAVGWTSSQVGGGATVWGGIACRPTRKELAKWPVDRADFEGWLAIAERLLGVKCVTSLGRQSARGCLGQALQRCAWGLEPAPLVEASRVRWGLSPVRPVRELWPWRQVALAERLGVDLRVGTRVTSLEQGRAHSYVRALQYIGREDGRKHREAFELFVISCGAIQTVRLFLLSGMASHDAEAARLIGRYMCFHLFGPRILVEVDHCCHQPPLLSRFHLPMPASMGAGDIDGSRAGCFSVHGAFMPGADWSMIPGEKRRHCLDFRVTGEDRPVFGNSVMLNERVRDAHGLPTAMVRRIAGEEDRVFHATAARTLRRLVTDLGLRVTRTSTFQDDWTRIGDHQLGGCRMSESPSHGVIRPDGRMHAMGNVFVVDTSTFPTSLAIPPTLAAVANAMRIVSAL